MAEKKNSRKTSFISEVLSFVESMVISVFLITMLFTYIFKIVVVDGTSMENTLMPDDRIITTGWYGTPERGDIVVIEANEAVLLADDGSLVYRSGLNKSIVKRIIATEGQTVDIDFERGSVTVDGKMLDESYITGLTHVDEGAFTGKYPITVPQDCVFVMGDNRGVSKDSRSFEIGFIEEKNIIGKVLFSLSSGSKIKLVK